MNYIYKQAVYICPAYVVKGLNSLASEKNLFFIIFGIEWSPFLPTVNYQLSRHLTTPPPPVTGQRQREERPMSVFMNIVLWLKSWYLAEKPVFPPKHYRGGKCKKSPQEIETDLINVNKTSYLVLILDSHSKRLVLRLLTYPDVNTIWKLSALSCDKKLVGISKKPVNTASAQIQGF